jgi:GNAT superfamily N-acetyltransferase
MSDVLADLSPASLAVAIKANLYAFFQAFRSSAQAIINDSASGFRWHTAIAHPWFNGVLSSRPPAEDTAQAVRDTLAYFQSRDVAGFTWWLAPDLERTAWSQHLLPHGFQYDDDTPGMAIDLAALPSPVRHSLDIQRVEDRRMPSKWSDTFAEGYGIPAAMTPLFMDLLDSLGTQLPFRHYLGLLDGKPVGTSTLFLGAGVAGIYNVATVPEARGQGIGSVMTLAPLYEARDMGYRAGVLQSSDMGYRVYQRLGFQKRCQIDHFYWSAPDRQEVD